jgi:hypothetical protein
MKKAVRPKPRFKVGDWVSVAFGTGRTTVQIVEDRGPIGATGRRLYEIRWEVGPDAVSTFPVPEESFEPAVEPEKTRTG